MPSLYRACRLSLTCIFKKPELFKFDHSSSSMTLLIAFVTMTFLAGSEAYACFFAIAWYSSKFTSLLPLLNSTNAFLGIKSLDIAQYLHSLSKITHQAHNRWCDVWIICFQLWPRAHKVNYLVCQGVASKHKITFALTKENWWQVGREIFGRNLELLKQKFRKFALDETLKAVTSPQLLESMQGG